MLMAKRLGNLERLISVKLMLFGYWLIWHAVDGFTIFPNSPRHFIINITLEIKH
jgi:hypothetical protein